MLGISRLIIAIRGSDSFRLAVTRFVAHAPHSRESAAAWAIISQASCMQPYTSRKHVHEAALTLGMRMHQARLLASPASSPSVAPASGAPTSTCEACGWRWTTDGAAVCPACKRRANVRKAWSDDDLARLQFWWGSRGLATIARDLGRAERAVYERATKLHLNSPEHYGSMFSIAREMGIDREALQRVLALAGVATKRVQRRPRYKKQGRSLAGGTYRIDRDEARAAVEAYLASETMTAAARRLGRHACWLKRRLVAAGLFVAHLGHRYSESEIANAIACYRRPALGLASPTAPAESGVTTRARGAVGTVSRRAA